MAKPDIYKVSAILLRNKKFLVTRSVNRDVFYAVGGKIESGESDLDCLYREVSEEIGCDVTRAIPYKRFIGMNFDHTQIIEMPTFIIDVRQDPEPKNEIAELAWISGKPGVPVASMLFHHIIPNLIIDDLIQFD